MRGGFRGEWWTDGGVPVKQLIGLGAGVALAWWLATILWELALIAGFLLVVAVAGVIILRRGNPRDAEVLATRLAEFHAAEEAQLKARQQPMIVNYYGGSHNHLYLTPGADTAGIIRRALPDQDAEIIRRSQRPE